MKVFITGHLPGESGQFGSDYDNTFLRKQKTATPINDLKSEYLRAKKQKNVDGYKASLSIATLKKGNKITTTIRG